MVRIIIDSACDLPKSEADKLNLDFLPLKTIFGDEEFLDGIDLTKDDFYTKLENSSINPQPAPVTIRERVRMDFGSHRSANGPRRMAPKDIPRYMMEMA